MQACTQLTCQRLNTLRDYAPERAILQMPTLQSTTPITPPPDHRARDHLRSAGPARHSRPRQPSQMVGDTSRVLDHMARVALTRQWRHAAARSQTNRRRQCSA
eukprot:2655454-Pyramimonas_sp.AAC.1